MSKMYSFAKDMRRKTAVFDKTLKILTDATMKDYLIINLC